jgi:hypothetical protein
MNDTTWEPKAPCKRLEEKTSGPGLLFTSPRDYES